MSETFDKEKLLMAFEYGIMLMSVAQQEKVEMNSDIVKRAEEIIFQEFVANPAQKLATDMVPILLSIFETNMDPTISTAKKEDEAV